MVQGLHSVRDSFWDSWRLLLEPSFGKGTRRSRNQWREAPCHWMGSRHSVNGGVGKEFYRKGNSVKRFRPFSESPDSKNWNLVRSSPSQISQLLPETPRQLDTLLGKHFWSTFDHFWLFWLLYHCTRPAGLQSLHKEGKGLEESRSSKGKSNYGKTLQKNHGQEGRPFRAFPFSNCDPVGPLQATD